LAAAAVACRCIHGVSPCAPYHGELLTPFITKVGSRPAIKADAVRSSHAHGDGVPELATASAVLPLVIPPVLSRLAPAQPLDYFPAVPWTEPCCALPHLAPPLAGRQAAAAATRVRRRGPLPVLTPPRPSEETEPRPSLGQPPLTSGKPRPLASLKSGEPHRPTLPRTQLHLLHSFQGLECKAGTYS
jgi:hypothetical protein